MAKPQLQPGPPDRQRSAADPQSEETGRQDKPPGQSAHPGQEPGKGEGPYRRQSPGDHDDDYRDRIRGRIGELSRRRLETRGRTQRVPGKRRRNQSGTGGQQHHEHDPQQCGDAHLPDRHAQCRHGAAPEGWRDPGARRPHQRRGPQDREQGAGTGRSADRRAAVLEQQRHGEQDRDRASHHPARGAQPGAARYPARGVFIRNRSADRRGALDSARRGDRRGGRCRACPFGAGGAVHPGSAGIREAHIAGPVAGGGRAGIHPPAWYGDRGGAQKRRTQLQLRSLAITLRAGGARRAACTAGGRPCLSRQRRGKPRSAEPELREQGGYQGQRRGGKAGFPGRGDGERQPQRQARGADGDRREQARVVGAAARARDPHHYAVGIASAMRRAGGFTLIELLITVAIVALLASVALPLSELSVQRGKEQELRRSLRELREAIDAYKRASEEGQIARAADQSGYPLTLSALVDGVADAKNPKEAKIYFLRRIPRDPFSDSPSAAPEQTWGLRSYESPADNPRPGRDVFDVYSLSGGNGMNGIPYKDW